MNDATRAVHVHFCESDELVELANTSPSEYEAALDLEKWYYGILDDFMDSPGAQEGVDAVNMAGGEASVCWHTLALLYRSNGQQKTDKR